MGALLWTMLQVAAPSSNWLPVIVAVIAAIPASIAAWIAGQALSQSRQNAAVAAKTDKTVDEVKKDGATNGEKLTEIHTLTNSNLSKVEARLDVSNKTIEGLNQALVESARRLASMEQMIAVLMPVKGAQSPSEANGEKLDALQTMLSNVQSGTPPIPVKDEAVLEKLNDVVIGKLDTIQETVDHPITTPNKPISK